MIATRNVGFLLLIFFYLVNGDSRCPEDSYYDEHDKICKCLPCPKHECSDKEKAILLANGVNDIPGNCCGLYECHSKDEVQLINQDELTDNKCIDEKNHVHNNGSKWQKDSCTNCTCENGKSSCIATMCKACNGEKKYLNGECCPICLDYSKENYPFNNNNNELCNNNTLNNCNIKCKHGYLNDINNCTTCQCYEPNNYDNLDYECQSLINCKKNCKYGLLKDNNDCKICECRPHNGCSSKFLCNKKCSLGYKLNKKGCPTCRCINGCIDNKNISHAEGSTWSINSCLSCSCEIGLNLICKETVCQVSCSNPIPPESGMCCPTCPHEVPDNKILKNWNLISSIIIIILIIIIFILLILYLKNNTDLTKKLKKTSSTIIDSTTSTNYPQKYYKRVANNDNTPVFLKSQQKIVSV